MFISNILKGFEPSTPIKYYINDHLIDDITNGQEWLDNGVCAHILLGDPIYIEDNCIIIKVYY